MKMKHSNMSATTFIKTVYYSISWEMPTSNKRTGIVFRPKSEDEDEDNNNNVYLKSNIQTNSMECTYRL